MAAHTLTDGDIIEKEHGTGSVIYDDISVRPLWPRLVIAITVLAQHPAFFS